MVPKRADGVRLWPPLTRLAAMVPKLGVGVSGHPRPARHRVWPPWCPSASMAPDCGRRWCVWPPWRPSASSRLWRSLPPRGRSAPSPRLPPNLGGPLHLSLRRPRHSRLSIYDPHEAW